MMNYSKLTVFIAITLLFSCSNLGAKNDILGLFQVLEKNCLGSEIEKTTCDDILYLEFVEGNFYGVSDNEVAFVIWSKSPDTELLYNARKIKSIPQCCDSQATIIVDKNDLFKEYLVLTDSSRGKYYMNANSVLEFSRIDRSSVSKKLFVYPGNE